MEKDNIYNLFGGKDMELDMKTQTGQRYHQRTLRNFQGSRHAGEN